MATLASDDFNRANSTDLGANWVERAGDWAITSNRAVAPAGSNKWIRWASAFSTNNYAVQGVLQWSSGSFHGVLGRATDFSTADNDGYYLLGHAGTNNLFIYKRVSAAWTLLATTTTITLAISTDYTFRLEINGSSLVGKIDGNTEVSTSNGDITANGDAGFQSGATGTQCDDFLVEDFGAAGGVPAGTLGLLGVGI